MPVVVEKKIAAKDIRVGDEVMFPGKTYTELVADVGPKQKYNHVSTDYGTTKIELGTEVTVFREQPTEEENAARIREQANLWVAESAVQARVRVAATREKLINNLDMRDASWHGRHWASYAEAQIELGLWNYVVQVAKTREIDYYDAALLVRDEIKKRLIELGHFLPRSTDMLNNYCTALESEVRLRFVQEIEWRV